MNKQLVIEELLEVVNALIENIDNLSTQDEEFVISHEVAEQLRDELLALDE